MSRIKRLESRIKIIDLETEENELTLYLDTE